jgi:hypothetical protein
MSEFEQAPAYPPGSPQRNFSAALTAQNLKFTEDDASYQIEGVEDTVHEVAASSLGNGHGPSSSGSAGSGSGLSDFEGLIDPNTGEVIRGRKRKNYKIKKMKRSASGNRLIHATYWENLTGIIEEGIVANKDNKATRKQKQQQASQAASAAASASQSKMVSPSQTGALARHGPMSSMNSSIAPSPPDMSSYMNSKEVSLEQIDGDTLTAQLTSSAQAQEELVDALNQKLRVGSDVSKTGQAVANEPAS